MTTYGNQNKSALLMCGSPCGQMDRMIVDDALREMEIHASVNHVNIVQFLGLLVDRNAEDGMASPQGFAMEYFPGVQLETILDELASP